MKAFISVVFGYEPDERKIEGGILGLVKAYYGCVEAQGRGTLHCHMMIWLEGGLNPNEIKERVIDKGDVEFKNRLIQFLMTQFQILFLMILMLIFQFHLQGIIHVLFEVQIILLQKITILKSNKKIYII